MQVLSGQGDQHYIMADIASDPTCRQHEEHLSWKAPLEQVARNTVFNNRGVNAVSIVGDIAGSNAVHNPDHRCVLFVDREVKQCRPRLLLTYVSVMW